MRNVSETKPPYANEKLPCLILKKSENLYSLIPY